MRFVPEPVQRGNYIGAFAVAVGIGVEKLLFAQYGYDAVCTVEVDRLTIGKAIYGIVYELFGWVAMLPLQQGALRGWNSLELWRCRGYTIEPAHGGGHGKGGIGVVGDAIAYGHAQLIETGGAIEGIATVRVMADVAQLTHDLAGAGPGATVGIDHAVHAEAIVHMPAVGMGSPPGQQRIEGRGVVIVLPIELWQQVVDIAFAHP